MNENLLSAQALFDRRGDPRWRPLLAHAAAFQRFLDEKGPKTPARRAAAEAHRVAQIEAARALRAHRPALAITREHERWLTEAVLVWLAYRETASAPIIDTVGTKAAYKFGPDLSDSDAVEAQLKSALVEVFDWTADEFGEMERRLSFLSSNLDLKHAIIDAIIAHLGHAPSAQEVHTFAEQVFGPLPTRVGDFDLVVTRAAFFLCIPFDGDGPVIAELDARPTAERDAVIALVKGINRASMSMKHVRFPAFGFFDPACLSPQLLQMIESSLDAEGISAPREVIAETLATMVTILPTQKLDMYLVHDIWGHGWQESLCEFEWIFERLVSNAQQMSPFDGAETLPAVAAGFVAGPKGTIIDRETLLREVDGDLRARIEVGINGVVAECLADLAEYKFIVEEDPEGHLMPSSSVLRGAAVKIDFTLQDTHLNQSAWSRPYRKLLSRESAQAELRSDLLRLGCAEAGLDEAIDEARALLEEVYGSAFVRRFPDVAILDAGPLEVTVGQRVFVAMILLAATIEDFAADRVARRAESGPQWENPTTSIDLLMLALGWFFDNDRRAHIWQLDQLLVDVIRPLLVRLEAAL